MITQCFVNAELRQADRAVLNYAWQCCLELDQQAWELNYAWECYLELDQQAGEGTMPRRNISVAS